MYIAFRLWGVGRKKKKANFTPTGLLGHLLEQVLVVDEKYLEESQKRSAMRSAPATASEKREPAPRNFYLFITLC